MSLISPKYSISWVRKDIPLLNPCWCLVKKTGRLQVLHYFLCAFSQDFTNWWGQANRLIIQGICFWDLLQWLQSTVIPIHKKGNRHLADNYWPISLTSVVWKMPELILCDKIMLHYLVSSSAESLCPQSKSTWSSPKTNIHHSAPSGHGQLDSMMPSFWTSRRPLTVSLRSDCCIG